jgi:hypothetical protein
VAVKVCAIVPEPRGAFADDELGESGEAYAVREIMGEPAV